MKGSGEAGKEGRRSPTDYTTTRLSTALLERPTRNIHSGAKLLQCEVKQEGEEEGDGEGGGCGKSARGDGGGGGGGGVPTENLDGCKLIFLGAGPATKKVGLLVIPRAS